MTVANDEYILAFIINQAGELTYEVRATDVVSTRPIDVGVTVPWGVVVHPGVLAAHHQHIFSLRVDPMIDGPRNSLVYEEAYPMARSDLNPHGTGYYSKETTINKEGGYDLDTQRSCSFRITSPSSPNPINGKASGYKVMVPDFPKMLADKESWHHKRAEFADHNIYVTKYRPGQLYAAGHYTNQSRGAAGVRTWSDAGAAISNQDIVVWVQFGINRLSRTEDFPVMPCEVLQVHLQPTNLFTRNPALDVPPSMQAQNNNCQLPIHDHGAFPANVHFCEYQSLLKDVPEIAQLLGRVVVSVILQFPLIRAGFRIHALRNKNLEGPDSLHVVSAV